MRFVFESPALMPYVSTVLSILVSGARIHLHDIQHKESQGVVEILMQRKEVTGIKNSFFGRQQPVYGQNTLKTLLIVKDVIGVDITTNNGLADKLNSSFTVLLGVKLSDNELYLGSVEEYQGEVLCEVSIKMKRLNVECIDVET
jgi:hypothetical protein